MHVALFLSTCGSRGNEDNCNVSRDELHFHVDIIVNIARRSIMDDCSREIVWRENIGDEDNILQNLPAILALNALELFWITVTAFPFLTIFLVCCF